MFPNMDLEVIKELYLQARKNKEVLIELMFQMENPEAVDPNNNPLSNALGEHDDSNSEDNQAAMIAEMAGMQMVDGHGAMTEQEIKDMQMAQQLQDKYIQRAQRSSQQQRPQQRGHQGGQRGAMSAQ